MLKGIRDKLTYANVMATIAVFIALGAGAYAVTKAPRNSVVSSSIKNGQVKKADIKDGAVIPAKLAPAFRPISFHSTIPIGGLTDEVLDQNGYRITLQCDSDGGSPQIDGEMTLPQPGTFDILQTADIGGPTDPAPAAGQIDLGSGDPVEINLNNPDGGTISGLGAVATYVGDTRSALISIHGTGSDLTDTCSLRGSIVPLSEAADPSP